MGTEVLNAFSLVAMVQVFAFCRQLAIDGGKCARPTRRRQPAGEGFQCFEGVDIHRGLEKFTLFRRNRSRGLRPGEEAGIHANHLRDISRERMLNRAAPLHPVIFLSLIHI